MKIIKLPPPSASTNILFVLFLILAVLYSFSGIFFGLDFTDSFYHLNQALNPADEIYLYPFFLSSVIINGLVELTGPEVIYIRMFNWLLLFASMLLPFLFLKVERKRLIVLLYFALVLILYAPLNANIFGYDTLSIFINSLLFSLTALYFRAGKFYLIPILSLICAVAILIRLPNMLAVPIIFCFLLLFERFRTNRWRIKGLILPGIYVLFTFLLTYTGYTLYYDNWQQFVVATSNSESHDLLLLLSNYLKDGLKLAGFVIMILIGLVGYKKLLLNGLPILKDSILFLFFIGSLLIFVGYTKYSANYALFIVALAIAIVIVQIYNTRRLKLSEKQLILYLFLFFLFINPFGSNTGLLKAYSLLLLLPFILSILTIKNKKYWLVLVAVLIPFSIFTKIFGIYEDKNLLVLDEKLMLEKLSPILTNSVREEFLRESDVIVQQLTAEGVEVFFYGDKSHIFHYLYPETSLNISSFFQPVDNLNFFKDFSEDLKDKDKVAVFIVNSYPENSPSLESLLELDMICIGFIKVEDGLVRYYLRTFEE